MKSVKRFIIVQDNDGSYFELDQTDFPSEANRLAEYYESCNVGKVTILSSYSDQTKRISLLHK